MIIERIVYCLVCLVLFGYVINKYLKSKSGIYLSLLAVQLVCILTQLIAFFTQIYVDIFMQLYILIFNVVLPSIIMGTEYLNINFEEYLEIKIGDFYARRNNYDKAIEKYKKAISKNNNNAQTFAKLGRIYNAKGDRRTAFDRFARAIEIDRNDYRSYYEIGVIFNDMSKQADAQIVLDNALRIKPDFTPASELLAVVLCAQNKYDEAINVYKNATRYDPDNYQLYYSMGIVRTELRDFNDAKACYEKAIELNPSLYQAYFSLGQINLLKGELEQAEKMFKKAMVSKELTAKSYYQLAKVYILNDEEIKAVTYLGYAIDIDSSYKYKAESEPLFVKIKDYITGLSMANKVMQKAENMESLKKTEEKPKEIKVNVNEKNEEIENIAVDEEKNIEKESIQKNVYEEISEKDSTEQNYSCSSREKLAAESRRVAEEDYATSRYSKKRLDDVDCSDINEKQKENKFLQVIKKVLGFDTETLYEEEIQVKSKDELEKVNVQDNRDYYEKKVDYENQSQEYQNEKNQVEYYQQSEISKNEVKKQNTDYSYDNSKSIENKVNDTETNTINNGNFSESVGTLDIFEKFKKLKKEEEEKAEKLRRIQKMKQLEELKQQENKNINSEILNSENNAEYSKQEISNYNSIVDNRYYEDDEPVVVRTVGTNDSEDARKELRRLEELRKIRNFEIHREEKNVDGVNSTERLKDIERKIEEEKNINERVRLEEVASAKKNENFEDEDTMNEPHFDFMDRFKRK